MNERIKWLRKKLGLTQNEFGAKLGLAANTVTNYETGRRVPSNTVITAICREFNINRDWLLTGKGNHNNANTFNLNPIKISASNDEAKSKTIGNRIKILRKTLKLNQTQFGKQIGVKQATITGYETGARIPLSTVILSICKEFNVNKNWLLTGEGGDDNMFLKFDEDERFAHSISVLSSTQDPTIRHIINTLAECSLEEIEIIKKLFH